MSNQDRSAPENSAPNNPPVDAAGKPVNVVERDLQDRSEATKGVDETITPTSTRTKEQEVEELNQKTAEIERKVADGN
ncbi:hypothetical protein ACCD10_28295 [Pseudomonas sp. Pseusp122]|uniref:hypothetical protein n=1 Tax=unclassified Pseudomonas TaxID=196821 RepID=UPI0039A6A094